MTDGHSEGPSYNFFDSSERYVRGTRGQTKTQDLLRTIGWMLVTVHRSQRLVVRDEPAGSLGVVIVPNHVTRW